LDEEYQIVRVDKPEDSVWEIIGRGIANFNQQQAGDDRAQRLCFAVQAPGFYERHGYQVFGELDNFPTGHQRYFLTKTL
jgi:hypothetical protein